MRFDPFGVSSSAQERVGRSSGSSSTRKQSMSYMRGLLTAGMATSMSSSAWSQIEYSPAQSAEASSGWGGGIQDWQTGT